jgi:hypothetical protein
MSLAGRIVKAIEEWSPEVAVRKAQLGLCYCAVELESGEAGVAYSFP